MTVIITPANAADIGKSVTATRLKASHPADVPRMIVA